MSRSLFGRVSAWFWQGRKVIDAKSRIDQKSTQRRLFEQHARLCAEGGDRVARPVAPLRAGPGDRAAALLYRESILASLRALGVDPSAVGDDPVVRACVTDTLPEATSIERLVELVSAPRDAPAVEQTLRLRHIDTEALASASHALLSYVQKPEAELQNALFRRLVRTSAAVFLLVLAIAFGYHIVEPLVAGPNIAAGKPWRASSDYRGFSAADGVCDGNRTEIFFHTNRETNPWVEIDLGEPTTIQRVDVANRTDCCRDRALPLVVEASLDAKRWQELGRRREPFTTWVLRFAPTSARYVRARALKTTFLHLESLEIR
jgi:hypothetical protein